MKKIMLKQYKHIMSTVIMVSTIISSIFIFSNDAYAINNRRELFMTYEQLYQEYRSRGDDEETAAYFANSWVKTQKDVAEGKVFYDDGGFLVECVGQVGFDDETGYWTVVIDVLPSTQIYDASFDPPKVIEGCYEDVYCVITVKQAIGILDGSLSIEQLRKDVGYTAGQGSNTLEPLMFLPKNYKGPGRNLLTLKKR